MPIPFDLSSFENFHDEPESPFYAGPQDVVVPIGCGREIDTAFGESPLFGELADASEAEDFERFESEARRQHAL